MEAGISDHVWPIAERGCWKRESMAGMTRREIAFLLIGVGFGLTLAMTTGYGWDQVLIVVLVLVVAIGIILLVHKPRRDQISN